MLQFIANVKSVKADIAKREITISFTVGMDDVNMETAHELSNYVDKDHGNVELKVLPRMQNIFRFNEPKDGGS